MNPTNTFINTLNQTPSLASEPGGNLQYRRGLNSQLITYPTYPQTIAGQLTKLNNALTLTSNLLTAVSIIPGISAEATELNRAIQVLQKEVQPAREGF